MMKNKGFTFWEVLIVMGLLCVAAAILFPIFTSSNRTPRGSSCRSNLKQIGLGYLQYAQDYDDKFPITTTEQGWFGALQPYLKSEAIFRCPSEEARGDDNLTDYWFNRRLAGVETEKMTHAGWTVLSGDGEPSDDPNASLSLLPPLWIARPSSPARRHTDEGNYLFADGHAKAFNPDRITLDKPTASTPTFLAR